MTNNAVFTAFASQMNLSPELSFQLQLMSDEGTVAESAGVTYWIDNGHSVSRVTNQVLGDGLNPVDDSSDEWVELMEYLDAYETELPEGTYCAFWFLCYHPTRDDRWFQAYAYVLPE